MHKPVFDVILTRREWKILAALYTFGETRSFVVHRKVSGTWSPVPKTHHVLNRLTQYGLVMRTEKNVACASGRTVRDVYWKVSTEGERLFFS